MTYREIFDHLADLIERLDLAPRYVTVSAHTPPGAGADRRYTVLLLVSARELSRVSRHLGEKIEQIHDESNPGHGWLDVKRAEPWGLIEFTHTPPAGLSVVST